MSTQAAPARPLVDVRVRWRAGRVALGFACVLGAAAFFRPLLPHAPGWVRAADALGLGIGIGASALLASLRGRGEAAAAAFFILLLLAVDGIGQVVAPLGWPGWPLVALLLAAVAVAEPWKTGAALAGLACALTLADAAYAGFSTWRSALAASLGYVAIVAAVHRALVGEKRRLSTTLAELARLRHGIDHLDEEEAPRGTVPRMTTASTSLRHVSKESRSARQLDRAQDLETSLGQIVRIARGALSAHSVSFFDLDPIREVAHLRATDAPPSLLRASVVPSRMDPFAFVLDRGQPFYATDFKRLLWGLPYYTGTVKIGSLLAVPVRTGESISGILVADSLDTQALNTGQAELLTGFAEMAAAAIQATRVASAREELGVELEAIYPVSERIVAQQKPGPVRALLLQAAHAIFPLDAAAVVMADEAGTRYTVADAHGWAKDYEGREVGLAERTWGVWTLRSADEPVLLDHLEGEKDRMPVLVLDEGAGAAESLLAVPLRAQNRTLGALLLMGKRGTFGASASRVFGLLGNLAGAVLSNLQLAERNREMALRDALTGLYNRRAFDELIAEELAREERQRGRFGVLLMDVDHFKKLNDTFGHPAGDAALKNTARILRQHLRKGDRAARYGGEEFVALLPVADEAGTVGQAERVRAALEKSTVIFDGATLSVTASFGVAVWPQDGTTAEQVLAAADRALYAAKAGGRNRVVAASRLSPPAADAPAPS